MINPRQQRLSPCGAAVSRRLSPPVSLRQLMGKPFGTRVRGYTQPQKLEQILSIWALAATLARRLMIRARGLSAQASVTASQAAIAAISGLIRRCS